MSNKPYTLQELRDLAQSLHDREVEKDLGVFISIVNRTGDEVGTCAAVGMDHNAFANVVAQIVDNVGPSPVMAALMAAAGSGPILTEVDRPSVDPLDAEVIEA